MDRIEFSIVTKRVECLKAAGTDSAKKVLLKYLADGEVPARMPRSKCRVCKVPLSWGSGTYSFDHRDNNSANISQKNCFLVCRNDHGKATKMKSIRQYNRYTGELDGYRPIKLKVGYKKPTKKTARKPVKKTIKNPAKRTAKKAHEKLLGSPQGELLGNDASSGSGFGDENVIVRVV